MLTAFEVVAPLHHAWAGGVLWFVLIPLFWVAVFAILFAVLGRRRWRGPHPYHGHPGWGHHGPGGAEAVLATRFANGDIDEHEYRARLEVLRASGS